MPVHIGPETLMLNRDGISTVDEWQTLHAGLSVLGDIIGQWIEIYENGQRVPAPYDEWEIWHRRPATLEEAIHARKCIVSGKMFPASMIIMTEEGPVGQPFYKERTRPIGLEGFDTDG